MHQRLLALAVLSLLVPSNGALAQERADAIYVNGVVVTLDEHSTVAQALAVKGDTLLAVGTDQEIRALASEATRVRDLGGKTIVPGFYAAHDHFPGAGYLGQFSVDLNSPPMGPVTSMDELIAALKAKAAVTPKGKWIRGRGYDDTLIKEGRHPTRHDLDKVSTEHPIWILHTSSHLGVGNTLALEKAKLTRDTPQPKGGKYRVEENGDPNGVIEETLSLVSRVVPVPSDADADAAVDAAVKQYVRQGVTTAVIASGSAASVGTLKRALARDALPFRVITMTSGGPVEAAREQIRQLNSPLLKPGAIKLLQDGSIQGYTGYLSHAYCVPFRGMPRTAVTRCARARRWSSGSRRCTRQATRSRSTATATPPSTTSSLPTRPPKRRRRGPTRGIASSTRRPRATTSSTR
jgi:predicted amidohydrolase YtcJ